MNDTDFEIKKDVLIDNIKANIKKYGKNFPYKAWPIEKVRCCDGDIESYNCIGKPKTVFSGRFCAVSGFVYAIVDGKYSVLVNLRGTGTPDYQGYWNAPCGFLECFETSKQGIQREIFEECGFIIDESDLKVMFVETDPEMCNNGNVSIRHKAFLGKIIPKYIEKEGGEENEVDSVKWVPIDDIDNYKWAFNHRSTIELYAPKKWKRKLIEFYYKWFKDYNKNYTDEYDVMIEDFKMA